MKNGPSDASTHLCHVMTMYCNGCSAQLHSCAQAGVSLVTRLPVDGVAG